MYSQAHRVLELYDRLRGGGVVVAKREAIEFQTSRRTLERDINVLREVLGGRLERDDKNVEGTAYELPHSKQQWKVTDWQVLAVLVGNKLTGFLSGRPFDNEVIPLLDQLLGSLDHGKEMRTRNMKRKVHVVRMGHKDYRGAPEKQKRLVTMLKGLLTEKAVRLSYHSPKRKLRGEPARKLLVHPLSLVLYRGGVYFVVDVVGGDWRDPPMRITLSLDHITETVVIKDSFDYPRDFDPEKFYEGSLGLYRGEELEQVVIRIDAEYAPYVAQRYWHSSQEFDEEEDGGLVLRMRLTAFNELKDWVLGMGEHAEVLAPLHVRNSVRGRLEKALSQYPDRTAT